MYTLFIRSYTHLFTYRFSDFTDEIASNRYIAWHRDLHIPIRIRMFAQIPIAEYFYWC